MSTHESKPKPYPTCLYCERPFTSLLGRRLFVNEIILDKHYDDYFAEENEASNDALRQQSLEKLSQISASGHSAWCCQFCVRKLCRFLPEPDPTPRGE